MSCYCTAGGSLDPTLQVCDYASIDVDVDSADESHSAGWKLQYFIYFYCDQSTPAMSTDSSQVDVALFPSF